MYRHDWHRLEFFRVVRGRRQLVTHQDVNDHGFYLWRKRGQPLADVAGPYAREVATEFLVLRPHLHDSGNPRWRIVLWRLDDDRNAVIRVCEVELTLRPTPAEAPV
ncbi:hypothetical protein GCM10012275_21070 [Longimycelium tulufanense]|uniref:Uncharacterized protein n=1 Tax=Longimycelium tulufanense TaxID=907463 RepID=A0A8J3CCT4_9PSEU|nr:hypothetical protein [Longimycelium tulufanense]GGM49975.1 hypothetical protein GCM10012275_21070 [Longimycelium tulufanense]